MKAIGVFGGAFAPFHNGHLRLAIEARDALGLEQVRLVPTAQPAHRPDSRVSPARRLEWLRLAVRRERGLIPDDCELRRDGPSYTVDTLIELRERFPRSALVLLMGADAFRHLHTWRRWPELLDLGHIAVFARPGGALDPPRQARALLEKRRASDARALLDAKAGYWLVFEPPMLDISSTRIRSLLRQNRSVRGLIPDAILNAMTPADRSALTQDDDAITH
ncbi:nicotinate-nucleotide adenylyltransferase [Sinimarinibacterium thermocellulolyticum]|uniref:Probable nicotinate-nucleotide adenylyltransferase n=1 Tax=Sinimarinibacterium thermocellulolyticum TaxID=3170016 RepID=A0ABV2A837_9GAMM